MGGCVRLDSGGGVRYTFYAHIPQSLTHTVLWSALTCHDVVGGHDHDSSDANAEDGILAPVEEGQAGGGLQ